MWKCGNSIKNSKRKKPKKKKKENSSREQALYHKIIKIIKKTI